MKWCDVHQVYFEFDEFGWPSCEQKTILVIQ